MSDRFCKTPPPPYYAVIFTSRLNEEHEGYQETGEKMLALALKQPGCLGAESSRDTEGFGITVSYWKDKASISAWKEHPEHVPARKMGREKWYEHFELRIALVESASSGP